MLLQPSVQYTRLDQLAEPHTALTAGTAKSAVTASRHLQQGLMRSEKVHYLTKLVNEKIEQLDRGNRSLKQRFRDLDKQAEQRRTVVRNEQKILQEDLDDAVSYAKEQDEELEALEKHEKATKAKMESELQDMKDRIKVLRLGKEKAQTELASVKVELAAERRKIDVFLDKDRDRLRYAKDVLQTRQLVMRSFAKEAMRVKGQLNPDLADPALEARHKAGRDELRRIQTMREAPVVPPKQAVRRVKTKSMEKPKASEPKPENKYKHVKSRLMKSIESSRNKETRKYVDPRKGRDVAANGNVTRL